MNQAELKAKVQAMLASLLDPDTCEVVDFEVEMGTRVLNPGSTTAWVEHGRDGRISVLMTLHDPARRTPDPELGQVPPAVASGA